MPKVSRKTRPKVKKEVAKPNEPEPKPEPPSEPLVSAPAVETEPPAETAETSLPSWKQAETAIQAPPEEPITTPAQSGISAPAPTPQIIINTQPTQEAVASTESAGDGGSRKKALLLIGAIALVGLLLAGGIYFFGGSIKTEKSKESAQEQIQPTAEKKEEAQPKKELDLASFTLKILNGSGKKGEAAKLKEVLEKEGFKIDSIGNADSSDLAESVIKSKKEIPAELIEKLRGALSKTYQVASGSAELEAFEKVDIIVIIGKNQSETR